MIPTDTIILDLEDERLRSGCSVDCRGYVTYSKLGNQYLLHRYLTDAPRGKSVDHINRNKLDNRKSNLRVCDQVLNMQNRGISSNNTSGYKGVSWATRNSKWKVSIKVGKTYLSLGYFTNKDCAALAYNEAARKYYGEFAYLNSIGDL